MSVEKAEIKMAVAHEIGCGVEDALESAKTGVSKLEGEKTAFAGAAKAVSGLLAHIQKDVKEGKLTMEQGEAAQRYVQRAVHLCENLRTQAEAAGLRAQGRVTGLADVVKMTKKIHDAEAAKAESLKGSNGEAPINGGRATGEHPGPSLRHQRDAETAPVSGGEAPAVEG